MKAIIIFIVALLMSACEYEKAADEVQVVEVCDTTTVSYSNTIVPIIQTNCYSCHSTAVTSGQGGLDLENYSLFRSYLNNTFQGNGIFGSQFYHSVNKSIGALPMPPGNDKLSDCDLAKIRVWIRQGGLNN